METYTDDAPQLAELETARADATDMRMALGMIASATRAALEGRTATETIDDTIDDTGVAAPTDDLFELSRTVRELRADLEALRRELATEVRTRRVVVVEDDGFERVAINSTGGSSVPGCGVHVYARPQGRTARAGNLSHVSLWAVEDEAYADQEAVGLTLWGHLLHPRCRAE